MVLEVNSKAMGLVTGAKSQLKSKGKLAPDKNFDEILNRQNGQSGQRPKANKSTQNVKHDTTAQKTTAKVEVKQRTEETPDVDLNQLEEDAVEIVTEILGISEEDLKHMLEQLNMTVLDLFVPEKLNTFLVNLFGVDDTMQLLTLPDVSQIKALKAELNQMLDKLDVDSETLQKMIKLSEEVKPIVTHQSESTQEEPMAMTNEEQQEQEVDTSKPLIEITDNRTDNQEVTATEVTATEVNPEIVKTEQDFTQVIADNQTVTKVEVVEQGGVREVVTVHMNTEDIMEQIVSSVKVNLSDDSNEMLIQLRPQHLGKLALSIISEQGVITANFMADNPAVKELIEANLAQLKVSLQEQGLNVDKLEVVVTDNQLMGDGQDSQQFGTNQDKKKRAARMMSVQSQADEEDHEEEVMPVVNSHINTGETNSIDYSV